MGMCGGLAVNGQGEGVGFVEGTLPPQKNEHLSEEARAALQALEGSAVIIPSNMLREMRELVETRPVTTETQE